MLQRVPWGSSLSNPSRSPIPVTIRMAGWARAFAASSPGSVRVKPRERSAGATKSLSIGTAGSIRRVTAELALATRVTSCRSALTLSVSAQSTTKPRGQ